MKKHFIYSLFLISAFVVSCGKGEKVSLRFKPEPGTAHNLHMTMNTEMGGTMMGQGGGIKMEMDAKMTSKKIRSNGDVEMDLEYTRFMMDMSMMGQKMAFDSDKDVLDPNDMKSVAFIPMQSILNKKLPFVMSERAKMVESPDMNALLPDSIKALLGPGAANNDANKMMENMFAVYPEEEIYEGYSWEGTSQVTTANGPIDVNYKYTVKSITDKEVSIAMDGTMNGEIQSMGMAVKMEGTITGTMAVNKQNGMTTSTDIVQDINTSVMGMKMNMKNTIKVQSN